MKTSKHHSLAATRRFDKRRKIRICSWSGVINGRGARPFWHGSVSRGILHHALMSVAMIAFRECRLVHAWSWRQGKLEDEIIGLLPTPDGRRLRMRRPNGQ